MRRAAALFLLACAGAFGQHYEGWVDGANCSAVVGWAWNWDLPNTSIQVDIYDGALPVATAQANIFRQDLLNAGKGDGRHGFSLPVPASLKDNNAHRISVYFGGTNTPLSAGNGGYVINCSPAGGYLYYYTDPVTSINASAWTQNGSLTAGAGGLSSADSNGGSLISRVPVPDGTSDYEVAMRLNLAASGGSYIAYLRATPDARLGPVTTGTFYAVELANPTVTATACTATLNVWKSIAGSLTLLNQTTVICNNGGTARAVVHGGAIQVDLDTAIPFFTWAPDSSITSGQGGVGIRSAPAGNSVTLVRLGPADRTPPNAIDPKTIKVLALPNSIEMRWQSPGDDPNGSGIIDYDSVPGTGFLTAFATPELFDGTVSPSMNYFYTLWAMDAHGNFSNPAGIPVSTPPAGSVDSRRVGVRSTGSYWGGMGENIDLLSGNLNFTLPLLQAQSRGGWKLPISLTYNSQNWRQDSGAWNPGADVGYGYGWKLVAGSLTPYWQNYLVAHHYIFTDASGAEYRLDVNNNGVWTSKDSIYLSYDSNTNRLYFNDGSFWVMGCVSAGTEQDAGTMYPTLIQDSNGNQIFLRYQPGVGVTWPDSSARIREIEDVRAVADGWGNYRTYTINYDNDPMLPHITSIVSWIGSGESYTFALSGLQTLVSPFDGSTQGSAQFLRSVTINGLNLTHQFETNGSGELTKVMFPYGGYIRWQYSSVTYSGSRTQREVEWRYLSKDGTAGSEKAYHIYHGDDSARFLHVWTVIDDPDGQGQKAWWFQADTSQFNAGLVTAREDRPHYWPATAGGRHEDYTWTTDAAGNRYIAAVLTTEDMGNPGRCRRRWSRRGMRTGMSHRRRFITTAT